MVLGGGFCDALKQDPGIVTPEPFTGALRRRHRSVGLIAATLRNVQYLHAAPGRYVPSVPPSIAGCWLNTPQVEGHLHLLPPAPGSAGTGVTSAQYLPISHRCQRRVLSPVPPSPIGVLGGHS